jgi:hypothetical protein
MVMNRFANQFHYARFESRREDPTVLNEEQEAIESEGEQVPLLTCFQGSLNDSFDEFSFESFVQFEIFRSTDDTHDQSWLLNLPDFQDELTKLVQIGFDVTAKVMSARLRHITVRIRTRLSCMFLRVPR